MLLPLPLRSTGGGQQGAERFGQIIAAQEPGVLWTGVPRSAVVLPRPTFAAMCATEVKA